MKRPLNEDECRITKKNIELIEKDLEYKTKVEHARLKLSIDVAPIEYNRQLEGLQKQLRTVEAEIKELTNASNLFNKQLIEGVDVIEEVQDEQAETD